MAKLSIVKSSTDVTVYIFIQNSSVTTGAGLTGLAYDTSNLVCYYVRPLGSATALTLATQTATGAHSDGGFVEVDSTNMPGVYRLDLSDAICATGVDSVLVHLKGASNMAPVSLEIQLTSVNLNDSIRAGMTALPNAAADAAGGLPISDAGGLDLDAQIGTDINNIAAKLPSKSYLAGSSNSDGDIQMDEATGNFGGSVASVVGSVGSVAADVTTDSASRTASKADVSALATAEKLLSYMQLLARSDAAIATDKATELGEINTDEGSGAGDYDNTAEAQEAIRDRGDAAWVTGGGGSISDIINIQPLIPKSIDLANTATYRFGLMLVNALDDLPSTAEITPGTISIERKAIGGTSWSAIVTDAACSEIAGLIYYDEVFDSGTGYAEGDSIRVTFKSQKVTVAANDYEIIGTTGRMFYTSIRQTMRGTDSAALASVCTESRLAELDAGNLPADIAAIPTAADNRAEMDSNSTQLTTIAGDVANIDGAAMRGTDNAATASALSTHDGKLDTVDSNVDTVVAKLPAGTIADSDEIGVVQDNSLGKIKVERFMDIPASGTNTYRIEFALYDMAGNMEAPDSAPTIEVVTQDGTSRNANLSATTMSLVSTGRYRVTYSVADSHAAESLDITVSAVEGGATCVYSTTIKVQDGIGNKIETMYQRLIEENPEVTTPPSGATSALDQLAWIETLITNRHYSDNSGTPSTETVYNRAGVAVAECEITEPTSDTTNKTRWSSV